MKDVVGRVKRMGDLPFFFFFQQISFSSPFTSNLAAQSDILKASVCPIGYNMGSLLLSKANALSPLSVLLIQPSSIQKKKCRREIVDFPSLNRCFVKGPNLWQKGYNDFPNPLWTFPLVFIFFSYKWLPIEIES